MNLDSAVNQAIHLKKFNRQFPPGVKHHASIDGPYNIVKMVPEGSVLMELGCHYGESTLFFWLSGKFKKIYAVDPYGPGAEDVEASLIANVVTPSNGLVEHMKMFSQDAIPLIPDASLDLCYIDAIHDYENVSAEIKLLKPKMKPGALWSGHDYFAPSFPGVIQAIHELLGPPDVLFTDTSWAVRLK